MKSINLFFALLFLSLGSFSQSETTVIQGSSEQIVTAYKAFDGNESIKTLYTIKDGVFHYYYINTYNNKVIEFKHTTCPIKSIDLKSVAYKSYEKFGNFMYLDTKDFAEDVNDVLVSDNELRGPSLDINLTTTEEIGRNMVIIVNSEEIGAEILAAIKKGKDL
jgi:hypothetical protein